MRGEDDRCSLLLLRLLGDAFGAVVVQGGLGAAQEVKGRLLVFGRERFGASGSSVLEGTVR